MKLFHLELHYANGAAPARADLYATNRSKAILTAIELYGPKHISRVDCTPAMEWS